jgi:hypothetical protein
MKGLSAGISGPMWLGLGFVTVSGVGLPLLAWWLSRRMETSYWQAGSDLKWWFVTPLWGMHATALQESPPSFRTRGVFITAGALSRV